MSRKQSILKYIIFGFFCSTKSKAVIEHKLSIVSQFGEVVIIEMTFIIAKHFGATTKRGHNKEGLN